LELELKEIQITVVNQLTFLPQVHIQLQNARIRQDSFQFHQKIEINLDNLSLSDLTQYPHTLIQVPLLERVIIAGKPV